MRTAFRSALAATAIALAALTAACGASPTEPTAKPKASQTQPQDGRVNSGFTVGWG